MKRLCFFLAVIMLISALAAPVFAFDETAVYGDVNGDGKINAKDVTRLMKALIADDPGSIDAANADVNDDTKLNARDVVHLMKAIIGVNTVRLGHNDKLSVKIPSTCAVHGTGVLTCRECGDETEIELALAPHSYDEGVVTKEPTCAQYGILTRTCTVCKATHDERIDPTGEHQYEVTVTSMPTCNKRGLLKGTCVVCGRVETEKIAANGHSYNENGVCTVCGKKEEGWYISQYVDENGELTNEPYIVTFGVGARDTAVTKENEFAAELVLDLDRYDGIETVFYLYKNGTDPVVNDSSGRKTYTIYVELANGTLYGGTGTMNKGSDRLETDFANRFFVSLFGANNDALLITVIDDISPQNEYAFYVFRADLDDAVVALK